MADDKKAPPHKQRKRVPLACLICKKRKVKCDKQKPTCSECIRNGVAHMCEYLEPHWSSDGGAKKDHDRVEDTDAYKQLQATKEKVIFGQRQEIEDLKRQLLVLHQLLPSQRPDQGSDHHVPITVLTTLSPSALNSKKHFMVMDDHNYSICATLGTARTTTYTDTYSWINLIKLDPQLTSLWYKITNLQKIYHTYKMNQLIENTASAKTRPAKKSDYRINEIDFTYAVSSPMAKPDSEKTGSQESQHRCPVIECDFNFMNEDSQDQSNPSRSSSPFPVFTKSDLAMPPKKDFLMTDYEDVNEKSKRTLIKIQNLWNSVLNLIRGNEPLNYKQLYFLLDFYFNDISVESKSLVGLYKLEIQGTIKKNGNEIGLNLLSDVKPPSSPHPQSDQNLYERLLTKGVYVCFLALIIDESLEILRMKIKSSIKDDACEKFKMLFPTEVAYANEIYKGNILGVVQEFLLLDRNLRKPGVFTETELAKYDVQLPKSVLKLMAPQNSTPTLSHISCCVLLLNRGLLCYKKEGSSSDLKSGYTSIFSHVLNCILNESRPVELWKDPNYVFLKDSKRKNKDLKIHICYLWTDLIRITNLITFNYIPILKHSEKLENSMQELYTRIEEASASQSHVRYLNELKSSKYHELKSMLQAHYLIAKISGAITFGIMKFGEVRLNVLNLRSLITECDEWIGDLQGALHIGRDGGDNGRLYILDNNSSIRGYIDDNNISQAKLGAGTFIRKFEVFLVLSYLRYFMKYIILLQSECSMEESLIQSLLPGIFIDLFQFVDHIRKLDLVNLKSSSSQYVLLAIIEVLTRVIQFVVGVLIRIRQGESSASTDAPLRRELDKMRPEIDKAVNAQFGCNIDEFISTQMVGVIEDTVGLLEGILIDKDKSHKLSKLWKFYMTFITNSSKMNIIHSNVPEFKVDQAGRIPNGSPEKAVKSEFKRCPISQITTPMDTDFSPPADLSKGAKKCPVNHSLLPDPSPPKAGKCPVNHNLLSETSPAKAGKCPVNHGAFAMPKPGSPGITTMKNEQRKRKCPFDHTMWNNPAIGKGVESNIRGKLHGEAPLSAQPSPPVFKTPTPKLEEAVLPPPIMNLGPLPQESTETVVTPSAFPGISERQAFDDFDFDFLHNESFFEQLNFSNGLDNMPVDGFFQ
ncbi:uncharacterized protein CANTADRAFT_22757 [Suhomyces tanzawaensis NRRL Y-17324]|uniref:Zn(2)-C6 fungal-type domain-containing protein n=1 Tax=Suhomyces tanzawaensis NRRL Y-17324 TaxID=984487 RepID=A0A1E4SH51_9ASCO|nr:uncharacterized protein CANTADRAFT_22757 [Suhomyces tanzawaensis NRRL Y-17324]ODV78805.1 hypothetical protein CANTADRAFT_22757 [Suhomyces tanzawaensis NRRL Y-17324]